MSCKMMMQSRVSSSSRVSAMRVPRVAVQARRVVLARGVDAAADSISESVEVKSTKELAVIQLEGESAFNALIEDAGKANDLVVVDYYTQWCGPCKLIAPMIEVMAQEYKGKGVRFAKVDCGKDNDSKKWAMALGIKVLPTFRLYKDGSVEHVQQVTGSKVENIRKAVEEQKAR